MKSHRLFPLFFLSSLLFSQTYEMPASWKFTTGDSAQYARTDYNDASWKEIAVPSQWETQGYPNYDGYAWYRVRFTLPAAGRKDSLFLLLGKIDDIDETYLNGVMIGGMGKLPPVNESAWNMQRIYPMPAGLLKQKNTLAIRVYDGGAPGGIIGGLVGLYTKKAYMDEMFLGPAPKRSYTKLTTSNGLIAAVYDIRTNRIESAFPHIFQAYDSAHTVRPFAFGIRPDTQEKPKSVHYEKNSHVIHAEYGAYTIDYFAPFTTHEKILYAVVRGPEKAIAPISFECHSGSGTLLKESAARPSERYFLFSFIDTLHDNTAAIRAAAERICAAKNSLVDEETAFMQNFFASCRIPRSVSQKERNVLEQSIAILKMAQVGQDEVIPASHGQILASLPPGVWNIAWVRDGSYSLMAMSALGMFTEARRGLEFLLTAPSNHYKNFRHKDGKEYGIGVDYQISVCRYFGNGSEESDYNDEGPNIEIDGFGLVLSAVAKYVHESHDTGFVRQYLPVLTQRVADPILHCIAENGLIRKESGPWERHLPGEQYSYTSATCAAGLQDFAALLSAMTVPADPYYRGAAQLRSAIISVLTDSAGAVIGRVGAPKTHKEYYDGGSFEVFASGAVVDSLRFMRHMAAFEPVLRVPDPMRGYIRIKSPDWYECQEWLFLDTRIASAYLRYGRTEEARHLLDWVTAQASFNNNQIPEMFGYEHATYEGAIPMVGFGAGTYVLSMLQLYR